MANERRARTWVADYQFAKHGTEMPLCGMGGTGFIKVRATGNENKARARAIAAIAERHIVTPENIRIIHIHAED